MAPVFGNAVLTLSFGDGTEMKRLGHRSPRSIPRASQTATQYWLDLNSRDEWQDCSLEVASKAACESFITGGQPSEFDKRSPESIYLWLESTGNCPTRPEGRLDQRGWTFQERLLSRRVLALTVRGIFWDCCRSSASDTRPSGLRGDHSPGLRDSDERKVKKLLMAESLDLSLDARANTYLAWRKILTNYTRRQFSYASDRVVAIEGVVQCMREVLQEECFLGLWEGDVLRSLMWFCDKLPRHIVRGADRGEPIIAPSWSWASVSTPIHYKLWHPLEHFTTRNKEVVDPCTQLKFIWARPIDRTSFSHFVGEIVLHGPLACVRRAHLSCEGCKLLMDPRPDQEWPSAASYEEIHVLPIFKEGSSRIHKAVYCLVLTPLYSMQQPPEFRRIGTLVIDMSFRPLCVDDPEKCQDERCHPSSHHPDEFFDTSPTDVQSFMGFCEFSVFHGLQTTRKLSVMTIIQRPGVRHPEDQACHIISATTSFIPADQT
ncbi:hypothetical protein CSHISOI_10878 [Colletotrichum shisoi]|uniref:Heterokaryon incompatibility domain-containing protein n=1 Tax=Colletotrichum shisoi TaxID=2078593 RepID=A0A5Q4BC81_9PEZI|nr:hypothetical protein CSHISOI_10878 [Colletotrichum shisoi]